jgi:hypothetical protein
MPASGNPVAGLGREPWDKPLSSAILYLAIVAIWACVLVPRWLHRSHETPSEQELDSGQEEAADHAEAGAPELAAAGDTGARAAEFATLREQVVEVTTYVEWEAPARPAAPVRAAARAGSADHGGPAHHAGPADHRDQADHGGRADRVRTAARAGTSREHQPQRPGQARPPSPAPRRAHVVRARRRLLTLLVALAVTAAAVTLAGLIRWWVLVPPAGMLGLYLLLLRSAAHSDAEQDRRRAEAQARAALAARERAAMAARDRARQAREALPQRTAEIIDISALATQGRDRDQPYDQYADAEVRAVGD